MPDKEGVDEFTIDDFEKFLGTELAEESPAQEKQEELSKSDNTDVTQTKAFAKRLRESTEKARNEEREAIAKSLGYGSYEELQRRRENQYLEDRGLDPEQASPIIEELVKQRLDNDPRMLELAEFKKKQVEEFGKKELAEITKLTGGEITSLAQLPKEVLDLWKTEGSLKSAYLKLEGERLINRYKSEQSRGSTDHLTSISGSKAQDDGMRSLTNEEKQIWKMFNPRITDDELDKKRVSK